MTSKQEYGSSTFTVFSVCVDQQTVATLMDGCAAAADTEFAGEFQEYIARNLRPRFSPRVRDSTACIAVVDFDRNAEQAAATVLTLQQILSGKVATVAVSTRKDPELLLYAMRAGCTEFVTAPCTPESITEILLRLQNRFAMLSSHEAKTSGSVICLYGVKGGVGTTTLAVHLSTFLVRQHAKKVLLIDHHHQLGHASLYLGVKVNPYHFDELIRNVDRLDEDLLAGFLTHHPSGLHLLPSPDVCAIRHSSTPAEIRQVLEFLRPQYDFVVLDSSLEYQDVHSSTMECSDEVYLITTPDIAALRDLSRHVENFALNETAAGKLRIVLNRSSSNDAVSVEQVENAVRFPVSFSVANNYAELMRAINAGEPISPQRRSEFTTQIGKWANKLVHAPSGMGTPAPKRKSFSLWK